VIEADYSVLAKRALDRLSPADRQLVDWHIERTRWEGTGFARGEWSMAVGYLLMKALGRDVTTKAEREAKATLDEMRVERMRELARKAA